MKGFTKDGKFHPIKPYNKVRKSRDNTTKEQGVRKSRNRFHPKGYKPPTFGKKKPAGTWEITKTEYGSSKNVEITKDHVVIFDDDGREVVYWDKKEWEDEPEIKPIIKNYIKLANQGKVEEIKEAIKPRPEQRWDFNQRKARDDPPVPFVTGRARTEILKNFWLDKLTHDQQTREFEQYKKDQIRIGYQPYQGDLADWREHQIYIISAFGE